MIYYLPVHADLTPDPALSPLPDGFSRARVDITSGLPAQLVLSGTGLNVLLLAPTGRGRYWLDLDKTALVASGLPQRAKVEPIESMSLIREALSPVMIFSEARNIRAITPLSLNARVLIPGIGAGSGAAIELIILGFSLFAAAMTGPDAGASWIELGWRRIDQGHDAFSAPVARKSVRQHLRVTTGFGAARKQRPVDADYASAQTDDRVANSLRGGLNWRLTHD